MRKELKVTQHRAADLTALIGASGKAVTPKEARDRLEKAVTEKEAIEKRYEAKMVNIKKLVDILRDENTRLSEKLNEKPIQIEDDYTIKEEINEIFTFKSLFD